MKNVFTTFANATAAYAVAVNRAVSAYNHSMYTSMIEYAERNHAWRSVSTIINSSAI